MINPRNPNTKSTKVESKNLNILERIVQNEFCKGCQVIKSLNRPVKGQKGPNRLKKKGQKLDWMLQICLEMNKNKILYFL